MNAHHLIEYIFWNSFFSVVINKHCIIYSLLVIWVLLRNPKLWINSDSKIKIDSHNFEDIWFQILICPNNGLLNINKIHYGANWWIKLSQQKNSKPCSLENNLLSFTPSINNSLLNSLSLIVYRVFRLSRHAILQYTAISPQFDF